MLVILNCFHINHFNETAAIMPPNNAMLIIRPKEMGSANIDSLKETSTKLTDLFIYTRSVHSRKQCSKLLLSVIVIYYHDKVNCRFFENLKFYSIYDVTDRLFTTSLLRFY